jgi:hypothetical protein
MIGSLAFDGAAGNAIRSLIRNRSLSRSGGNVLRSGDPAARPNDDRLARRQGEHPWDSGTRVEVDSGVKPGGRVVLNPPITLADGSNVRPRPDATASAG